MWDKTANLRAYDNIEKLSNYNSPEELEKYREHLLKKSKVQAGFISSYFEEERKLKVFEACSGNARLLYQLHINGIIEQGTGVEISSSRVKFAEEWKKEFNGANITNICGDMIKFEPQKEHYDLAICITGALAYFYPIDIAYPKILINKFSTMLKSGGILLLELYQHANGIKFCMLDEKKEFNTWVELPESDPFRYYLMKYIYHEKEGCLDSKEIFIKRDGFIDDSKNEVLKIYSLDEIRQLLENTGFKIKDIFSEWDKKKYNDSDEKLIIVTQKI